MNKLAALLAFAVALSAVACAAPSENTDDAEVATTSEAVTVCQPAISGAAITKQIVSVGEPTTLTVELVTISPKPFSYKAAGFTFPAGFVEQSFTSTCTDNGTSWRCRHDAVILATTAMSGTGNYAMTLAAQADGGSGCASGATQRIPFSLTTESFGYDEVNGG